MTIDGNKKVTVKEQVKYGTSAEELKDKNVDLKGSTPIWYCFSRSLKTYKVAYGVCHLDYTSKDGKSVTKLPFIFWCTEKADGGAKMIYSSAKIPTARKIPATNDDTLQCGNDDDIEFSEVVQKVLELE